MSTLELFSRSGIFHSYFRALVECRGFRVACLSVVRVLDVFTYDATRHSEAPKLMAAVAAHPGPPRLSLVKESSFLPSLLSVQTLS